MLERRKHLIPKNIQLSVLVEIPVHNHIVALFRSNCAGKLFGVFLAGAVGTK